ARRRDRAGLAEALDGVAERTSDEAIRADLLEETAWLASEDSDAGERFDQVARIAPERRGVLFGKALVAARRRDAAELASALVAQAEQTSDRAVGAALLLRAATLAEVSGDGARGAGLTARALALAPDDAGALVAAAERPGVDGDRSDLLARRAALTDDPDARADLDLERAELLARAGRLAEAGRVAGTILAALPEHLGALHLLRRLAAHAGDAETEMRASLKLGRSLADPALAAR